MKYLKHLFLVLVSTLPLSIAATYFGQLSGCENAFEIGCDPGLGNLLGAAGIFLGFASFITYPIAGIVAIAYLLLERSHR